MNKYRYIYCLILCCLLSTTAGAVHAPDKHIYVYQPPLSVSNPDAPKLILIIDDIGNNFAAGQRALALPGAITYAFLPFTPAAKSLAQEAHDAGKEIMLHAPMSSLHHRKLGPGALTPSMDKNEFQNTLRQSIRAIPYLSGINNHMGSELTKQTLPMKWLMEEISCHDLYFVDSRTDAASVAANQAHLAGIDSLVRDVFLDNDQSPTAIEHAFELALEKAKLEGQAVVIGHPHPTTLAFLEKRLPALEFEGVQLTTVSEALQGEPMPFSTARATASAN